MQQNKPIFLDYSIYLIDGFDLGMPTRTGTYVMDEEQLTLVETGPSPSIKHVKKGLEQLGFSLENVKYIIVTHIHLDHAGGAGLLLQECPHAKVVVHQRGLRHLAKPERLVAGARAVYGESFEALFEPIISIPEARLLVKEEGDTLEVGPERKLVFLDTPGHSKHHFSIFDPVSNGIFTGDTVGVRYEQLVQERIDFFLPSTSPNQFDPDAMHKAIDRIRNMHVDRIYYGHFGMTEKIKTALNDVSMWLDIFVREGEQVVSEGKGYDVLAGRLLQCVKEYLRTLLVDDDHEVYKIISLDMDVCAMGIMDYLQKKK